MIFRFKLLPYIVVAVFLHSSVADAGTADDIVAIAQSFCSKTQTGKSYASFEGCMDYQREGALIVQRAIQRGYSGIAMACLKGAKYEQYTDLAAAGLCIIAKEPGIIK